MMSMATGKAAFSQDEVDIRALIEAAHQVHRDKDAAAIVARYAPGAPIFNLAPPLVHHGVDLQEKQTNGASFFFRCKDLQDSLRGVH